MTNQDLTFPYRYYYLPHIGKVFVPSITLKLQTKNGPVDFDFIVDTGADLTTIPKFIAEQMGIDLSHLPTSVAEGLGGFRVKTWLASIDLHFENTLITVRASVTDENSTPPLLGRVDLLDKLFNWHFDSHQKKIVFESLMR